MRSAVAASCSFGLFSASRRAFSILARILSSSSWLSNAVAILCLHQRGNQGTVNPFGVCLAFHMHGALIGVLRMVSPVDVYPHIVLEIDLAVQWQRVHEFILALKQGDKAGGHHLFRKPLRDNHEGRAVLARTERPVAADKNQLRRAVRVPECAASTVFGSSKLRIPFVQKTLN